MEGGKLLFADAMRGIAAMMVVLEHALNITGFQFHHIAPWFSMGQLGVALFFIVSGFVIPFSIDRYSRVGFAAARILRIYPTYAAAFSLTLMLNTNPVTGLEVAQYFLLVRDFFGDPDIDPVVWTLMIEMKFYVLCVLFTAPIRMRSPWLLLVPVALSAISFILGMIVMIAPSFWLLTTTTASMMISFMFIGTAFYLHHSKAIGTVTLAAIAMVLFLALVIVWSSGPVALFSSVAWNYEIAILIFATAYMLGQNFPSIRLLKFFAAISYPLYVVHVPMIYVAGRFANGAIGAVSGVALSVAIACLIHIAVERPTHRTATALANLLSQQKRLR